MKRNRLTGLSLAIFGAIFWGASGTLASYMFSTTNVSTLWVVGIRLMGAGILLLISYLVLNRQSIWVIWRDAKYLKQLLFFSFLGVVPSQLLYFLALRYVNPATATVLQFTSPIFIIVYISFSEKSLPNKRGVLSILMAILGTFLLATKGDINSLSISSLGLVFGIGAGIGNAAYTLIPINLLQKYDAKLVCGWAMILGSLPILPAVFWGPQPQITANLVTEMVFIVVVGTMLAYLFFISSINYLNPAVTGVLGSFEPLTATLLSILFLGVKLDLFETIGGILILMMAIMQSLPENHNKI